MGENRVHSVEQNIIKILISHVEGVNEVNTSSRLESIGVDSLAYIKILVSIEQEFEIEIDDDYLTFGSFKSVEEIVNYVNEKVNQSN